MRGAGLLQSISDIEVNELHEMLSVAEKIIEIQRQLIEEAGITATQADVLRIYLPKWNAYIKATTSHLNPCPALSPNSRKQCMLVDSEAAHGNAHRAAEGAIAWALTEEDKIRWRT